MLRTRILTAMIMRPIVALVLYLGGIPWLPASLVGALAWREMIASSNAVTSPSIAC